MIPFAATQFFKRIPGTGRLDEELPTRSPPRLLFRSRRNSTQYLGCKTAGQQGDYRHFANVPNSILPLSVTAYPTLKSYLGSLGTERECQRLLCKVRWPDGDVCPQCGSPKVKVIDSGLSGKRRERILHRCRECDHHFSETAGTIFHDTRLELRAWFLAIYLMGSIENGIRPAQLETYLGISHETALNMVERIRAAIKEDKHFIEKYVRLPERHPCVIEPSAVNRSRYPTLHAMVHKFATEEQALEHLARVRWPNGPACPRCQSADIRKTQSKSSGIRPLYRCISCKKQFSATSRTFLKKRRHVSEWLIATYLVEMNPRGVSPRQLQRLLGLSYRTATRLERRLRNEKGMRKTLFEFCVLDRDSEEGRAQGEG